MKNSGKFRWSLLPSIMFVFALAVSPFLASRTLASSAVRDYEGESLKRPRISSAQSATPLIQKVGLYVLGITDLNVATGSYTMDVYLNFRCSRPCDSLDPDHPTFDNPDPDNTAFDVMNATGAPDVSDQTSDTQGGTVYFYRVRVPLGENLILKDFPFDYHYLSMQLEDKIWDVNDLVYEYDPEKSGVDKYAVVSGWQVKKEVNGEVVNHVYPIYPEPYSRLTFKVAIYHPWFSSFMKGLFAAIVIVGVGMLSFLMKYDEISERLALTTSTLVGAILYHLTLTSSIPPVGYLTFADKFMLANYVIVFLALAVTVGLMLYVNAEEKEKAMRLHKYTRRLIPGLWIFLTAYLIVFGMSIPLWEYIANFGF